MAFGPEDLVLGLERLFAKRGFGWSCEQRSPNRYEFNVAVPGHGRVEVTIRPLPPDRLTYASLFPRTLLEARAGNGADLDAFRRDILLAFLRVTG